MPIINGTLPIPRGLADPHAGMAYVVDLQGLIHQLDLHSGTSLARTPYAGQPLVLYQGSLIGWGRAGGAPPGLRLFSVARVDGSLEPGWETQLELPDWVELDSAEAGRFSIDAQITDGQLTITWEANTRYAGGAPPPPGVVVAESRSERWSLQIDPASGAIVSEIQMGPSPDNVPALPALPAGLFIVPYLRSGDWATVPWKAGSQEVYLVRRTDPSGVFLVRSGVGGDAAEESTQLTTDPNAEAAVTPDGGQIFLHEPGRADPNWAVFSVPDAELQARLPYDPGTEDVAVLGERVLYLVVEAAGGGRQFSLRSRDLQTGEAHWSFLLGVETAQAPPALQP